MAVSASASSETLRVFRLAKEVRPSRKSAGEALAITAHEMRAPLDRVYAVEEPVGIRDQRVERQSCDGQARSQPVIE